QHERQSTGIEARLRDLAAQPTLDRKQKLDAAGASADERDARASLPRQYARLERLEAREKSVDRLDGNRMLARARHIAGIRRRADIERQQVVGHRRTIAANYSLAGEVDADGFVLIKPSASKARQRAGVDMGIVAPVVAGDEAGQHAGIRRVHLAADQG